MEQSFGQVASLGCDAPLESNSPSESCPILRCALSELSLLSCECLGNLMLSLLCADQAETRLYWQADAWLRP